MKHVRWTALAALAIATPLFAQSGSTNVVGTASIYRAGGNTSSDDGTTPPSVSLNAGTGRTMTITATGTWTCNSGSEYVTADGGTCAGSTTAVTSAGKISGFNSNGRNMPLVGVFLGSTLPSSAPGTLTYGTGGISYTAASYTAPLLGQVFFIGDGLTGTGSGANQIFSVPDGATSLWLGVADSYAFQGAPSYYYDNSGTVQVTYSVNGSAATTTPEPNTMALLGTGFAGLVPMLRRRKA